DSAEGASCTCCGSSRAPCGPATPSACSRSDRMPSDRGVAADGSPQASHFIGGSGSVCLGNPGPGASVWVSVIVVSLAHWSTRRSGCMRGCTPPPHALQYYTCC